MPGNQMDGNGANDNSGPSDSSANYFYDLKRKQEEIESRIQKATNYLTQELAKFKRRML